MCMNCGCGQPDDRHGNPANLTADDIRRAGDANGQSLRTTAEHILDAVGQVERRERASRAGEDAGVPAGTMSGMPASEHPTASMSGLGPEEQEPTGAKAGETAVGRSQPQPADRARNAAASGGSAMTSGTGRIGGFDQPVLDRPTIDEEVSPRRGTPETES